MLCYKPLQEKEHLAYPRLHMAVPHLFNAMSQTLIVRKICVTHRRCGRIAYLESRFLHS